MVYQAGVITTNPKYNTPAAIAAARASAMRTVPAANSPSPMQAATQQPSSLRTSPDAVSPAVSDAASTPIYQASPRPTSGWSNVVDTFLAPWQGKPTYVRGTNNNAALGAVVSTVTGIATLGSAAYGGALAYGASPSAATAVVPSAAVGGAGSLRNLGIAAGSGAIAGALLTGGTKQQQSQDQAQGPTTGTNTTNQNTTNIDRSVRNVNSYQDQYTVNTIANSPGASLGGSPSQSATADLPSSVSLIPSQSAPFSQEPSQSATQSATASQSWLIPALIVGAALIYSKR